MKKVLLVTGVMDIGGAEKVIRDIAYHADLQIFDIHLLILKDKIGVYEQELLKKGCKSFHVPEPSENYVSYFRALIKLMNANRYHAVHAHTMFNCGWVMLAARICGVPVRISHSHSALKNGHSPVKFIYEKLMQLFILTCSTDLVACGVAAGNRLFGRRAFEQRGKLILNGVDIPAFAFREDRREEIRRNMGLEECFLLGHAGHLADVKNQAFLIRLMPSLLQRQPNAHLLLLGEGEDRPMLEALIQDLDLHKHITMTGNVRNVADYLSAMDVFVFPSLFEGMPLSILEVQANGLPCVISDAVPEDVFLTDLIHPLSLNDPQEAWLDEICSVSRGDCEKYNLQLRASGFSVHTAMEKIYDIYKG